MGFKPVDTRKFKKWLLSKGLKHIRTEASHEIWDYPNDSLLQPVVFRGSKKEIPPLHIKTNLRTLGIDDATFRKEIEKM